MRDEQDRRAQFARDPHQFELQFFASLRIERAERLVHQQQIGLDGERAREIAPLLHAARDLRRVEAAEIGQPDELEQVADAPLHFCMRQMRPPAVARKLETVGDVLADRAPREQARMLKDEAGRAVMRAACEVQ